jgi:hypothetical protein
MPIIPLNRISSVDVNVEREVSKLAAHKGPATVDNIAMQQVYLAFNNLKTLKFFRLIYERYGNKETENARSLRTYDIFVTDPGNGKLVVIVDLSFEALDAFLDDGSVATKLRGWMEESCKRVVDTSLGWKPMEKWDRFIYGKGTTLPPNVKAIPFYKEDFVPGVPVLLLIFIKQ